ncbi:Pyridoxamine 5'-phosphate oxidase [Aureococcus anophagefferens]|uniref:Pyridoxamine 5'-phosphate oxidase n=1 Tax=Aureococcus anophagefferens TaxID=44056 RepID=A0ABR1G722_AURAN
MAARHMRRLLVAVAAVAVAGLRPSTARAPGRSASRASVAVADATNVDVASEPAIYLSSAERARTTAELGIATGAALSTLCAAGSATEGAAPRRRRPRLGRVLRAPVLLLDTARAEHSKNLLGAGGRRRADADAEDRVVLEALFGVNHAYADDVLSTAEFDLYRLVPESVYFVGGFGVAATWVPVDDYGDARADAVAKEARDLCVALNDDKRSDDRAMAAAQLLDVADAAKVSVMAVDRLGLDLRVKRAGGTTEEYRLAYRAAARSVEDAKSEINKLLQEAWELDQGVVFDGAYDDKPKVVQRAVSSLK